MRSSWLLVVCLVAACFRPPPPPPPLPLQILEVRVEPPAPAPDRIARLPVFVLQADRDLAPPGPETVWLISGVMTQALRSEATRGVLDATNRMHRIDADIALDPDDASQLRVTPRAPLAPDSQLVLIAGARLIGANGTVLAGVGTTPGVLAQSFQVAPARECPPLARLAFPLATDAPRVLHSIVLAFDRPLTTSSTTPLRIFDANGDELPISLRLGCPDPGGARCLFATPEGPLASGSFHRFVLEDIADDMGQAPQLVTPGFTTGENETAPTASVSLPLACASDEIAASPLCVRADRGGLVLRGQTTAPGAVRARIGGVESQSPAGIDHILRLDSLANATVSSMNVWTVGLDGTIASTLFFEGIAVPPARAPLRIVEVLAHPRSSSAQEFVEIENVGDSPFDTGTVRIVTPSGSTALPSVSVQPLSRAVIVGASFDPRGTPGDPAVAAGTVLIRLDGALAGRGLPDRGADVWLADATGQVISRAPTGDPSLAPREGISVVRADSRFVEDDPAGWSYDAAGGSTPGLPDRLR